MSSPSLAADEMIVDFAPEIKFFMETLWARVQMQLKTLRKEVTVEVCMSKPRFIKCTQMPGYEGSDRNESE